MLRTRTITTIGVALALTAPATAGAVLSPDADDANRLAQTGPGHLTPDARDANTAAETGRSVPGAVTAAQASPAVASVGDADGFDWGDAGIGAAGTVGLGFALAGTALLANQRRQRPTPLVRS